MGAPTGPPSPRGGGHSSKAWGATWLFLFYMGGRDRAPQAHGRRTFGGSLGADLHFLVLHAGLRPAPPRPRAADIRRKHGGRPDYGVGLTATYSLRKPPKTVRWTSTKPLRRSTSRMVSGGTQA